jgi:hypothetical protein
MPLNAVPSDVKQRMEYLIDDSPIQLGTDQGISEYLMLLSVDLRHSDNLFPKIQQGSMYVDLIYGVWVP